MKKITNSIFNKLNEVESKEDFILFFKLFREYYSENKDNLENNTMESFLEAMEAFMGSSDNYYKNFEIDQRKLSHWRLFADILMAATVYE